VGHIRRVFSFTKEVDFINIHIKAITLYRDKLESRASFFRQKRMKKCFERAKNSKRKTKNYGMSRKKIL